MGSVGWSGKEVHRNYVIVSIETLTAYRISLKWPY